MFIYGNILGQTQCKGGLTHGRSAGNNHQVALLPAARHLVKLRISRRNTRQTAWVGRCFLKNIYCLLNDRINLRVILLYVLLRDFKKTTFGFLHQQIDVNRIIEGLFFNSAGKLYQLSGKVLLGKNVSMIFYIGRRGYTVADFKQIAWSADIINGAFRFQLLCHGHNINRTLAHIEVLNGLIDFLVARLIKRLGTNEL